MFHFFPGLVVYLFLHCQSFVQYGKGSLMSLQYKTCFAVSVDCKLVIREAILPSHKPNTPPLKTSH